MNKQNIITRHSSSEIIGFVAQWLWLLVYKHFLPLIFLPMLAVFPLNAVITVYTSSTVMGVGRGQGGLVPPQDFEI